MPDTSFPEWLAYLAKAIAILYGMIVTGIAIGKTGRHPLWALLILLPFIQILSIWFLAYCQWPSQKDNRA